MLTQEEKAEQWRARSAFDNEWSAEQETIRRVKRGEHVVVDRARFERLREFAAAHVAKDDCVVNFNHLAAYEVQERVCRAMDALQPGDLDPLP